MRIMNFNTNSTEDKKRQNLKREAAYTQVQVSMLKIGSCHCARTQSTRIVQNLQDVMIWYKKQHNINPKRTDTYKKYSKLPHASPGKR